MSLIVSGLHDLDSRILRSLASQLNHPVNFIIGFTACCIGFLLGVDAIEPDPLRSLNKCFQGD